MGTFVKWFFSVSCVFAAMVLTLRLSHLVDNSPLRTVALTIAVLAILAIMVVVKWEKWKRKKEGYYVFTRGGAEDGSVTYNEAGRTLELYFDRVKNTIYVPSEAKWKEIMPTWAKDRKEEIMIGIKKHVGKRWIGKSWMYEETDAPELLMSQRH